MKKVHLFCLALLVVLAAGCFSVQGVADSSGTMYCNTCNCIQTFTFAGKYEQYSNNTIHIPVYKCNACGAEEPVSTLMGAHSNDTAKCGTAVCTVCGLNFEKKHDYVYHDYQAATCTEDGWLNYVTCTRCDYTTYEKIPAGHDLVSHDAQAATCTEIGWEAYETCQNCTYTTYREIPALNHDLVSHDAQAATCTEIGWEAYETCSRCEYTTYKEIPP